MFSKQLKRGSWPHFSRNPVKKLILGPQTLSEKVKALNPNKSFVKHGFMWSYHSLPSFLVYWIKGAFCLNCVVSCWFIWFPHALCVKAHSLYAQDRSWRSPELQSFPSPAPFAGIRVSWSAVSTSQLPTSRKMSTEEQRRYWRFTVSRIYNKLELLRLITWQQMCLRRECLGQVGQGGICRTLKQ